MEFPTQSSKVTKMIGDAIRREWGGDWAMHNEAQGHMRGEVGVGVGGVDQGDWCIGIHQNALTGTNLQYHLSVDLRVDDDWRTGESKRGVRYVG